MNCHAAADHLELYAASECPPDLVPALEAHLAACPACRGAVAETRQLMGLLDLHWQEGERLRRLHRRIAADERRRSRLRLWAAAATLLFAVGLGAWLLSGPGGPGISPIGQRPPRDPVPIVLSGVSVVWAAPGSQWKALAARKIELKAGEIWLRAAAGAAPLEIVTPTAVVTAPRGELTIDVRSPSGEGDPKMRMKSLVTVSVLSGLVALGNGLGSAEGTRGDVLAAAENAAPTRQTEGLARRFGQYYEPVKTAAKPRIPAYGLPLDLDKVANYDAAAKALRLPADEASLKKNGFIVLPGAGNEDIVAPYKDLFKLEVPIFVTTDTVLHLYHIQFDETLREIEEREFYPDMLALTQALISQLEAAKTDGDDARAARTKALTYLAVGLKALDPKAALPAGVDAKDVDAVLERAGKHEGFWPNPATAHDQWPLFRYSEDFSQYVPRGHYTRSEALKKYFVGMMWFGRMTFLLKGDTSHGPSTDQPALVSVAEADQQTLAAALLTKAIAQAELTDKRKARDVWERIYAVTSFYVGLADDLGLAEYQAALTKVCGSALDLGKLADGKQLLALRAELAKHQPPAIYSGTGAQMTFDPNAGPEALVTALDKTTGFRLMGQRFIPDSYMMGKLVFPTVGRPTRDDMFTRVQTRNGAVRGFPRGLDVMSVLGSKRAREITHDLGDDAYAAGDKALSYDQALAALQKEYAGLSDADWNRNLYWSWLHALKPLLAEHGEGYPTFMTTEAYRTKSLNTAMASWAQLRHDTILYAKQSYSMGAGAIPRIPKPVQGYVEPVSEFYARLLTLSRMTSRGLGAMKALDDVSAKRLGAFEKLLERLLAISEKELANEELPDADYKFIREFGSQLEPIVSAPSPRLPELRKELQKAIKSNDDKKIAELRAQISLESNPALMTTLIADVHTDQNTRQVLEEGTGYVDLGVFVYRQPDGRLVVGAGPVLSYYEFKHPMADRLTDEKWREVLKQGKTPQPEWTKAYLSSKGKYVCPPHYSMREDGFR